MMHHQAEIDDDAVIGGGTIVWQFATVIRGAIIGEGCSVGACAIVDGAMVGNRCTIGHGAQVHPGSKLGDDVFIGPGAILCNDRWPRTGKAGFDVKALLSREIVAIEIGDRASIGAGAIILPGVKIGEDAMIAAGAVVCENVPPGCLVKRSGRIVKIEAGRPANRLRRAA